MNNKMKAISIQWIGPAALFALALVLMLFNFSTKSQLSASNTVNRNIEMTAQTCASIFNEEVTSLEKMGVPVAEIVSESMGIQGLNKNMEYEVKLLEIARVNSSAYLTMICDEMGTAIDNRGEQISVRECDFFEKVREENGVRYLYTMDDGVDGKDAIIVAVPISTTTKNNLELLLFYSIDNMRNMVKKYDFSTWNLESIIDRDGNVIASFGSNRYWKQGDNIFEVLKNSKADLIKSMRSQINSKTTTVAPLDEGNSLVYTPLGSGDWTVVFGVPQTYIDKQIDQQWKAFRSMMYQLVVIVSLFIAFVVAFGIVSKIYTGKKQEQLESKADTDLLTGLNNKLATERKIKEFMAQNPNSQSMMFIFDIDNFKKINDTMGHAFGDEVLRSLGQQIRVIFRASDIVGRAGGDEFIVFLKNVTEASAIRKEAKKVEDFFKDFKAGEYTKYSATASIGAAIFPQEGADFESLYKAADSALYKAKKRGKNQLAFYNEEWTEV